MSKKFDALHAKIDSLSQNLRAAQAAEYLRAERRHDEALTQAAKHHQAQGALIIASVPKKATAPVKKATKKTVKTVAKPTALKKK